MKKTAEEIRAALEALKKAGCRCEKPLIGERPGVGPRCRLCNVVAALPDKPDAPAV